MNVIPLERKPRVCYHVIHIMKQGFGEMEKKNPIQVSDRLFHTLEFLADNGAAGLMEVSETLRLNKSTAHRILTSLQHLGYVRQRNRDGKYELTLKIVEISEKIVAGIDVLEIVRPHLKKLMEKTGETVHFVKRDGKEAVYIDKVASTRNSIQMVSRIGSRIPLYCSGVGKALAATFSREELEELWKQSTITSRTPYTITDYQEFLYALEDVRRKGYALDNEENEVGVRCVAAALNIPSYRGIYAFSISAPVNRMDNNQMQKLSEDILKTKKEIEKKIF